MSDDLLSTLRVLESSSPDVAALRETAICVCAVMPSIVDRSNPGVHLTASALVIDPTNDRVLLVEHPKFSRWLQLGGHCDGDSDLARVALREAEEESGLEDLTIDPVPFDIDLHPGEPSGGPHMHLDVRFAVTASAGASSVVPISPEGLTLAWFSEDNVPAPDIGRLVRLGVAHRRR